MSNIINYEKPWYTLEDYVTSNNFGRNRIITQVPNKFKNEFTTVEEMWTIVTVRIQKVINMYLDGLFDLIDFETLNDLNKNYIKNAIFDTFESILFGRLPIYANVETIFTNNNQNYSITNGFKNNLEYFANLLTDTAIKWINMTGLKLKNKINSYDELIERVLNKLDPDKIVSLSQLEEMIKMLDFNNMEILKEISIFINDMKNEQDKFITDVSFTIKNWTERLEKYELEIKDIAREQTIETARNDLPSDQEFLDKIASEMVVINENASIFDCKQLMKIIGDETLLGFEKIIWSSENDDNTAKKYDINHIKNIIGNVNEIGE